jgi:hypothetical protein
MKSDSLLPVPANLVWLEPGKPVNDVVKALAAELQRELSEGHILFGVPVVAVARRTDSDDVLFVTAAASNPLAVVHLTWTGESEPAPHWPRTTLYEGWQDWIVRRQMPDHSDRLEQEPE